MKEKEPKNAEAVIKDIRRRTKRKFSSEEKIRIVISGLRGDESINTICRKEGIAPALYYRWSKDFIEAGKRRLNGDTFYLMYYVTKLNDFAFNNLHGGYGTQNVFISLMYKLLLKRVFSFEQFVKEINNPKYAIQQSSFVQGNLDLKRFSTLF
jgi:hypothetical protein